MGKNKTVFLCNNCGYESIRWLGRCPSCQEWNTLEEFRVASEKKSSSRLLQPARPVSIAEIDLAQDLRMLTGISELDRVLGGG
jgi:DNA repair protein RadA/Sms